MAIPESTQKKPTEIKLKYLPFLQLFGDESDEVAIPNLFYGKTLIELAQLGENKLLVLKEEEEEDDDDDEEADAIVGPSIPINPIEVNVEDSDDDEYIDEYMSAPKPSTKNNEAVAVKVPASSSAGSGAGSGSGSGSASGSGSGSGSADPQPGTSSGITHSNGNGANANDEEEVNENLQYAWEALEMAKRIFQRLGDSHFDYLAETYYALGDISMENQNNMAAIEDYSEY